MPDVKQGRLWVNNDSRISVMLELDLAFNLREYDTQIRTYYKIHTAYYYLDLINNDKCTTTKEKKNK